MDKNPFGAMTPYNIEGDYQKALLEICEEIDELREIFESAPHGDGTRKDLKRKIKSLIFKMSRNSKFYDDKKKGEGLTTKKFKELREELDSLEKLEELEDFIDKLNLMTAQAKVFLKSFEDSGSSMEYKG